MWIWIDKVSFQICVISFFFNTIVANDESDKHIFNILYINSHHVISSIEFEVNSAKFRSNCIQLNGIAIPLNFNPFQVELKFKLHVVSFKWNLFFRKSNHFFHHFIVIDSGRIAWSPKHNVRAWKVLKTFSPFSW